MKHHKLFSGVIVLAMILLLAFSYFNENVERFKSLCSSVEHRSWYPYNDDQKRYYTEFKTSKFTKVLGKKQFKILKNPEKPVELKEHIEIWLNGLKDLKKKASTMSVTDLKKQEGEIYTFNLYRKGRNHAKVMQASITQSDTEIIIKDCKVIGVIDEYQLLHGHMNYYAEDPHLKLNTLDDMWKITENEKIIRPL